MSKEFKIQVIPLDKGIYGARIEEPDSNPSFYQSFKTHLERYLPTAFWLSTGFYMSYIVISAGMESYTMYGKQNSKYIENPVVIEPALPEQEPNQVIIETSPISTPIGVITGSLKEHNLTINNQDWEIDKNAEGHLKVLGDSLGRNKELDVDVLHYFQQRGLELFIKDELDLEKYPIEYWSFHIGNGTASVIRNGINPEVYDLLAEAGIYK